MRKEIRKAFSYNSKFGIREEIILGSFGEKEKGKKKKNEE